eukprot:8592641-Pyramimonas_sp.AAC.1
MLSCCAQSPPACTGAAYGACTIRKCWRAQKTTLVLRASCLAPERFDAQGRGACKRAEHDIRRVAVHGSRRLSSNTEVEQSQ